MAHEADAPGFSSEGSEAGADFEVVVLQQPGADGGVIEASGSTDPAATDPTDEAPADEADENEDDE